MDPFRSRTSTGWSSEPGTEPQFPQVRLFPVRGGPGGGDVTRTSLCHGLGLPTHPFIDRAPDRAHTGAVATRISHLFKQSFSALRYEPSAKRVRATLGGQPVVDTTHALLVWEPRRIVPIYAVPESDVLAELTESAAEVSRVPEDAKVLTPDDAFALHTAEGTALDVRVYGHAADAAAFRLADPDLDGAVLLDFWAFDWREEDQEIHAHPRDPFHRVDIVPSSRHVRVELDGMVLAESAHPVMLFEGSLPPRYYVKPEEVRWDALVATKTMSMCPYKGTANYWAPASGGKNVAWSYAKPLPESAALAGLVCFYNERTDFLVDGKRLGRPQSLFR